MENIKSEYNNSKFKISAPTWNDEFDLPDGSYSVSNIQYYFEHIFKKHDTIAGNSPVQIYLNKIKNRIVFKIRIAIKRNNAIFRKLKKKKRKKTLIKIKIGKLHQS